VAGWRETKILKLIDKAVLGAVSELSGRNKSERIGGLVKPISVAELSGHERTQQVQAN